VYLQNERAAMKAATIEMAELQRGRGTLSKQLQYVSHRNDELEKQKDELNCELGALKNGTHAKNDMNSRTESTGGEVCPLRLTCCICSAFGACV